MAAYQLSIAGINKWAEAAKTKSIRVARDSIRELGTNIIEDAPIDTGFMVASSVISHNQHETYPLAPRERPEGFDQAFEAQPDKIAELRFATAPGNMTIGDSVGMAFVANYTPYVHDGTSKQASQPFITDNLRYWPSIVRRAIAKYKK